MSKYRLGEVKEKMSFDIVIRSNYLRWGINPRAGCVTGKFLNVGVVSAGVGVSMSEVGCGGGCGSCGYQGGCRVSERIGGETKKVGNVLVYK